MPNYYQTLNFAFQTPQPSEDLDIPGDMKLLADQVDDTLAQQINNNIINGATLTTNGPTNTAEVVNGILVLNLVPITDVSGKYDKTGGTISGNASITGTLNVTGATSVPTPTLSSHAATKGYVDGAVAGGRMIGEITMWGSSTAPAGWLLCNGAAIPAQYTTLKAMYGNNTPDLRNKFIVGAGGTYAVKSSTGSSTVTLATANMPTHNHGTTAAADTTHGHTTSNPSALGTHDHSPYSTAWGYGSHNHGAWTDTQGNHSHTVMTYEGSYESGVDGVWIDTVRNGTTDIASGTGYTLNAGNHGHNVGLNSASEGHSHGMSLTSNSMAHSHATVVNSTAQSHLHNLNFEGSGAAFSIVPDSYALTYIVFAGS